MAEWWSSLDFIQQFFYTIGSVAFLVTIFQLILSLVGIGSDSLDIDFDLDGADVDHPSGAGIFSMQTLSAFFVAFGWTGVVSVNAGLSILVSVVLGSLAGAVFMYSMYLMIRYILRLQSRGNLDYSGVIGHRGTVYVSIPGDNVSGGGQIQLNIQGRFTTANAIKKTPGGLKPGAPVVVVGMVDQSTFFVEEV